MRQTLNRDISSLGFLAELLRYPDRNWEFLIQRGKGEKFGDEEDLNEKLCSFLEWAELKGKEAVQELYISTFDFNPHLTLELGWHLYGEDYARGELLAYLRALLREHQIPENGELPDHLTLLLNLWERGSPELRKHLSQEIIVAGVRKVLEKFPSENPYRTLLEMVEGLVMENFPDSGAGFKKATNERGER